MDGMVWTFGNSVLSATFHSAKHRVPGTGLARLEKVREKKRETDRERERERKIHCLGLWENQFALPLFVLLSVSHTVSTALHVFDPLHCLFSQH